MSWQLHAKSTRHLDPIRISGKHLLFSTEFVENFNIKEKKFVKIFFDDEEKLIGLKFLKKQDNKTRIVSLPREKFSNLAHVDIFTLMKKIGIPLDTKKGFDYQLNGGMIVFSYRELIKDKYA